MSELTTPIVERTAEGCRCNACIKRKATITMGLQRVSIVLCDECASVLFEKLGGLLLRDEVITVLVKKKEAPEPL